MYVCVYVYVYIDGWVEVKCYTCSSTLLFVRLYNVSNSGSQALQNCTCIHNSWREGGTFVNSPTLLRWAKPRVNHLRFLGGWDVGSGNELCMFNKIRITINVSKLKDKNRCVYSYTFFFLGAAVAVALASLLTGSHTRSNVAILGEITFYGKYFLSHHIQENQLKSLQQNGIEYFLVPAQNGSEAERRLEKIKADERYLAIVRGKETPRFPKILGLQDVWDILQFCLSIRG